MDETDKVAQRYERRRGKELAPGENLFQDYMFKERELIYEKILKFHFPDLSQVTVLEIGAGTGGNIYFFKHMGIKPQNIYANELLQDRIVSLKTNHPEIHVLEGDALKINNGIKFDIVFQSTVFTSILDMEFRKKLAGKMTELTKNTGIILWYDFTFNNPQNKDVKRVTKKEIKDLFPSASAYNFYRVTLAPPIGRRVGNFYSFFNIFPFLRTHLIALIIPGKKI